MTRHTLAAWLPGCAICLAALMLAEGARLAGQEKARRTICALSPTACPR
jgi:hypothetical protein